MHAEELEARIRRFVDEVWNKAHYDVTSELYGDRYVNPLGTGPEARNEPIRRYRASFPDVRLEIEELIVGEDVAVMRAMFLGTDTGGYAGRPPTGRAVREWVVAIMHVEDDKIVREWVGADKLGMFIQLGVVDDPWPS